MLKIDEKVVNFYRGEESKYNPGTAEMKGPHWDALYFSTDSHKILLNGIEYSTPDDYILESSDNSINIETIDNVIDIKVNTNNVITENSAIHPDINGKLDIYWENFN